MPTASARMGCGRKPALHALKAARSRPPGGAPHPHGRDGRRGDRAGKDYSSTWMFFRLQIDLRTSGHTVVLTSPMWAVLSRYMNVRD